MARQQRLKASLESREGDERLPVELLAEIGIFKYFKPDKLAEFPGSVVLRRYKETETICREGEAGWTAFYIVPAEDICDGRGESMRAAMSLGRLSFPGVALAILACGCGPSYMSSPLAVSEENESAAFVGRYFGGGTHFGRERRVGEGTWGRDYSGLE